MTKGRKPKPQSLKKLAGNPGKRKPKHTEPEPPAGVPDPPDHLDADALAEWQRMAPELEKLGLLSRLDLAAFAGYCMAWSRWVQAERSLKEHGPIVKSPSGYPIQNPYLSVANTALKHLRGFLAEFGLSPSSRARVKPTEVKEEDPLDSVL